LEALTRLGINPIYLLSQIVVFSVLAFLLIKFLYTPILDMLEKRAERIAKGLEDARAAEEARARADEDSAMIVKEARGKAQQIVAEANTSAETVRANIEARAEEQARRILAQAREDAGLERDKILSEMRGQIGALAIAAAQKLIGETLGERRQLAMIQQFFSGIKAGEITLLDSLAELEGKTAIVTSALPLGEIERANYTAALAEQLGQEIEVSFRVDPTILGGVSIQVGSQVVDDSVAGKLNELKAKLTVG
jgi:F-type H+-transporting ATPase subunit b